MASADFFVDLPGVEGETTDAKMKGKLDISSFSWGLTNSGSYGKGGGGGVGAASPQDFHFTKSIDKATPLLAQSCATGKHFPKASLLCRKSGGTQMVYYQIDLNDVMISSYQVGGSEGSNVVPTEQISLNFTKALWVFTPQDAKGNAKAPEKKGYDFGIKKLF